MNTVYYYLSPKSPWTYLGHERLLQIASKHKAQVEPRPFDLAEVFPLSGGLPLNKRAPQRQAYRLVELQRWATYLDLPLNLHPAYFPVDDQLAATLIAAATLSGGHAAATKLAGALLRAVWAQERDIADVPTLLRLCEENQLDGAALFAAREPAAALYQRYTQEAIKLQAFGAPWYVYKGVSYWGQDRLDFLDRALAD